VVENRRLSDRSVALILKRCVGHAGFAAEEFSGHSLRAGFATSAAAAGANERDIMQHTRPKSEQMSGATSAKGRCLRGTYDRVYVRRRIRPCEGRLRSASGGISWADSPFTDLKIECG
jgi:integrase